MILGIGIDHVRFDRLLRALRAVPALRDRLFTPEERELRLSSLAARFAAKEAMVKALGGHIPGFAFTDMQVPRPVAGQPPRLELSGGTRRRAQELGVTAIHLSLTHEDPLASAMVVLEGES